MVHFINLTTQEKKVLGFLLALALLGGGVLAYRTLFEKGSSSTRRPLSAVPTLAERKVP